MEIIIGHDTYERYAVYNTSISPANKRRIFHCFAESIGICIGDMDGVH